MLLSIIIATYNRANAVKELVEVLEKQFTKLAIDFPKEKLSEEIELVVVDNNSQDDTGAILFQKLSEQNRKKTDFLKLNYFLEIEQGSSPARNRGIKEAKANLLAFLDDDIELDANWLKNVYQIALTKPENLCQGGRVIPIWQAETLPEWLSLTPPYEIIQSCFPAHDHGLNKKSYPFEFADTARKIQNPISACFICSKDIFLKHGDFRLDLGIKANERGACEDTEFFWRLLKEKINVEYNPEITVLHPIVKEKISKDFVLKWYRLLGQTLEYMKDKKITHLNPEAQISPKPQLIIKLWLFRIIRIFSFTAKKSFWFDCQKSYTKGQIDYQKLL